MNGVAGLLARNRFRFVRQSCQITASTGFLADGRRAYTTRIGNFRIRAFFLTIELLKYVASHRSLDARLEPRQAKIKVTEHD
jgi:hypothetical protein